MHDKRDVARQLIKVKDDDIVSALRWKEENNGDKRGMTVQVLCGYAALLKYCITKAAADRSSIMWVCCTFKVLHHKSGGGVA
jgi:hypothetical protein